MIAGAATSPMIKPEIDQSSLQKLVGYASARASVQLKKSFREHLGPLELKAVEFSILMIVNDNEQVNQKQIGRTLDVSAPNLAVILDRLQERGLVRRERGSRDRREQHVKLTLEGRKLARQARAISETMESDALKVLSEAERLLLLELLHKVAAGGC